MVAPSQFLKLRDSAQPLATRTQDAVSGTLTPIATALNQTPIMGAAAPSWIRPDIVGGYSQTAAPEAVVAYHKDALGYVHTKLSLTHTAGTAAATVAFTYGLGYRSSEVLPFMLSDAAGLAVAVSIDVAGQLSNVAILAAGATLRGYFVFLANN